MTNPNDPAFMEGFEEKTQPSQTMQSGQIIRQIKTFGLTKREYFAGKMMQGLLANEGMLAQMAKAAGMTAALTVRGIATLAVQCADALIVELNTEPK